MSLLRIIENSYEGFGSSCEWVSDHLAIGSVLCSGLIGSKHVWEPVAEVISASRLVGAVDLI